MKDSADTIADASTKFLIYWFSQIICKRLSAYNNIIKQNRYTMIFHGYGIAILFDENLIFTSKSYKS